MAILHPGIAAFERPVRVGRFCHAPQRLKPFASTLLDRDEQPRAERSAGMAEFAPGSVEPPPKRANAVSFAP